MYLELGEGGIEQKGHVKLEAEVSCVDISPLADDAEAAALLAVGTWDMQVHVFSLPAMALLVSEPLGGEVIPRSVLFAGVPPTFLFYEKKSSSLSSTACDFASCPRTSIPM